MAEQGYGCEFGECRNTVNVLITRLSPASTVSLCDEHYAPGLIPLLAAELGLDPGKFYANVERYMARAAKEADKALATAEAAAGGPEGTDDPGNDDGHQADDGLPEPNFYPADGPAHADTGAPE